MLFNVSILFACIEKYINEYKRTFCFLMFLTYFAGNMIGIYGRIFQLSNTLTFLPFYYLGYIIRSVKLEPKRKINIVVISVNLLLFILWYSLKGNGVIYIKYFRLIVYFILNISAAILSTTFIPLITHNMGKSKLMGFISKKSMVIYLFHQQIIFVMITLLNGRVHPLINIMVNLIVAIAISTLIGCLLSLSKKGQFLIGEK